jgi:hypothetical protein
MNQYMSSPTRPVDSVSTTIGRGGQSAGVHAFAHETGVATLISRTIWP